MMETFPAISGIRGHCNWINFSGETFNVATVVFRQPVRPPLAPFNRLLRAPADRPFFPAFGACEI